MFQSTHPRGVRHGLDQSLFTCRFVSIHAPARGATLILLLRDREILFQSTHPRGVRLLQLIFDQHSTYPFQSTHPRGVRLNISLIIGKYTSFNPRTREGCDKTAIESHSFFWCFNPRTREGCDIRQAIERQKQQGVSIHAPARGATSREDYLEYHESVSIHAPARGATTTVKAVMIP